MSTVCDITRPLLLDYAVDDRLNAKYGSVASPEEFNITHPVIDQWSQCCSVSHGLF